AARRTREKGSKETHGSGLVRQKSKGRIRRQKSLVMHGRHREGEREGERDKDKQKHMRREASTLSHDWQIIQAARKKRQQMERRGLRESSREGDERDDWNEKERGVSMAPGHRERDRDRERDREREREREDRHRGRSVERSAPKKPRSARKGGKRMSAGNVAYSAISDLDVSEETSEIPPAPVAKPLE
ncbi:hypothetical protein KIPB_012109, partial [Kipferlia bialata]